MIQRQNEMIAKDMNHEKELKQEHEHEKQYDMDT